MDQVFLPKAAAKSMINNSESLETLPWKQAKKRVVSSFEKNYLRSLLRKYHGVVAKCARQAKLLPSDSWKLLRKYDIIAKDFRSDGLDPEDRSS